MLDPKIPEQFHSQSTASLGEQRQQTSFKTTPLLSQQTTSSIRRARITHQRAIKERRTSGDVEIMNIEYSRMEEVYKDQIPMVLIGN